MEQKYYAPKGSLLSLSIAEHSGKLTKEDLKQNLMKAMKLSAEYGEDWIADLKECWYQRSGMIMLTEDESLLESEEEMASQAEDMLNPWVSGWRTEMILRQAGVGEDLLPLNQEKIDEMMFEKDNWTLRTIITEHLPYEEPMY